MEERKTPRMHKYGESMTRILMTTVRHVTTERDYEITGR